VTYTVTVTNGGPSSAATVSLTDTLAPNTNFVSMDQTAGPTFSCVTPGVGAAGTITCTIATLTPGASATFSIVLHLASSVPSGGSLANVANVSTTTADPVSGNNTSTTSATVVESAASADLSVLTSGPGSIDAGSNVTYTVVVTNSGPFDASTVSLTDTLPSNTTFVSINQTVGPTFTCVTPAVGAAGTITCTIATFGSGASATFSIVLSATPLATGQISNTASVTATTPDPVPGNNSSTTSSVVNPAAAIPTLDPLAFVLLVLTLTLAGMLRARRAFPTD
jgi:uncharacterized repeat protein (TIGR01451 family)